MKGLLVEGFNFWFLAMENRALLQINVATVANATDFRGRLVFVVILLKAGSWRLRGGA